MGKIRSPEGPDLMVGNNGLRPGRGRRDPAGTLGKNGVTVEVTAAFVVSGVTGAWSRCLTWHGIAGQTYRTVEIVQQKAPICGVFAKPSGGLEPPTR
jgi:hypothetical protein